MRQQADADAFDKVRRAPRAAHHSGIESNEARIRPRGDKSLKWYLGQSKRFRDIVGRSHRQNGDRNVPSDEAAGYGADSAISSGHRD